MGNDMINTSIEYLKRFFLRQSVYDFDGMEIMYSAMFLAIKVEEVNFPLNHFVSMIKGSNSVKIVQNEAFLIKGLKFQFFIYSPYRQFEGL